MPPVADGNAHPQHLVQAENVHPMVVTVGAAVREIIGLLFVAVGLQEMGRDPALRREGFEGFVLTKLRCVWP